MSLSRDAISPSLQLGTPPPPETGYIVCSHPRSDHFLDPGKCETTNNAGSMISVLFAEQGEFTSTPRLFLDVSAYFPEMVEKALLLANMQRQSIRRVVTVMGVMKPTSKKKKGGGAPNWCLGR